jgi:hypothetical protein
VISEFQDFLKQVWLLLEPTGVFHSFQFRDKPKIGNKDMFFYNLGSSRRCIIKSPLRTMRLETYYFANLVQFKRVEVIEILCWHRG